MLHYSCKCGQLTAFGTYSPWPCEHCEKCGSDLSLHPDFHNEAKPHKMEKTLVPTDDGLSTFTRCKWCRGTKEDLEKRGDKMEFDEEEAP